MERQPLNVSVSKLERFQDFINEKWGLDQQKFLDYLLGREQKTFEKDYGTALHKFLENPGVCDGQSIVVIDGFELKPEVVQVALACHNMLPKPNVSEAWVNKIIRLSNGVEVNVRGKVDKLCPGVIHDFKTTRRVTDYEEYESKQQHKFYMWMGEVDNFVYDVFAIYETQKKPLTVKHTPYDFVWQPQWEADLLNQINGFYDFINRHNLVSDWNNIVSSNKQ